MNLKKEAVLKEIQDVLETLLSGNDAKKIETESLTPELEPIAVQLNQLSENLSEMKHFITDISQGNLDGPLPCRHNYIASPLKQLHSQLSALICNCQQLKSGYVVGKLDGTGKLFSLYNELVDSIAEFSIQRSCNEKEKPSVTFNSWRYHQILQTLDLLHVSVLEADDNGHIVFMNRSAKERFGDINYVSAFSESDVLKSIAKNITIGKSENSPLPSQEIYEKESSTWYRITADRFLLPTGQAFYFNAIEDISEWKINEHQLRICASMDAMTGTYNRKSGMEILEKLLSQRTSKKKHCIAFIDIDGLKSINDFYGHSEGDYTIKSIANVLLSSVRDTDIICRYGGDEFLVIFENCSEITADKIISRMHEKLGAINLIDQKPYTLSFSHGVVPFSNCTDFVHDANNLLQLADQKMYWCKNQKKNNA